MAWTVERLENTVQERLGGARLAVVANREPYIHVFEGDTMRCIRPASGLATALDPVMRACGGVWVAHGGGSADRATVDQRDCVAVPPEDPRYTLRRVWLSKKEEQGYYYGLSNDALWPLCHIAYARPRFDAEDWKMYRRVNRKFADAVLDELDAGPAVVFVQDYHFALLPRMLKDARSDLIVAQFWHIPWPNREVFRVCPWQEEILDGLLGNDLLAFHIQYHCNNFLDTVDRAIEAKVDTERFAVTRNGHTTRVRPHPISIDPGLLDSPSPDNRACAEFKVRKDLGLQGERVLVGVDRVDYTKGIPERFAAVDRLLERRPELKGTFSFVQVGAPSRVHIPAYRRLNDELDAQAERINRRHGRNGWRPIVFLNSHRGPEYIYGLYRMAAGCVVELLARRHEPGGQGIRGGPLRRAGRPGPVPVHRRRAGIDRRRIDQPLRNRRVRRGPVPGPEHAARRAGPPHAPHAQARPGQQRLSLGGNAALRGRQACGAREVLEAREAVEELV